MVFKTVDFGKTHPGLRPPLSFAKERGQGVSFKGGVIMKAMVLKNITEIKNNKNPLELMEYQEPVPRGKELLIRVSACGVCHTELDEIEGRTMPSFLPVIPGHQIIGKVVLKGSMAGRFNKGDRVGVAWINSSCGKCDFCLTDRENLCPDFKATGRDVNGGYAQYTVISEDFAYSIPEIFTDEEAAPLLCAGAIGYRSLRLSEIRNGHKLGLSGFGGSAHLILKMIKYRYPDTKVFVYARRDTERSFAMELGASWAGDFPDEAPEKQEAIIDTTPAWKPAVEALKNLKPGGRLVVNAIRKEEKDKKSLLELDYARYLWMEKEIKSVANVTRKDVSEFLELAAGIHLKPEIQVYPLEEANRALLDLKERKIRGSKVLKI
jgi:alcohol dehydrogenase, propanol-preferring